MSSLADLLPPAWAAHGRSIHLGMPGAGLGPGQLLPASSLPAHLPRLLDAMRQHYAGDDARALLSQWSKYYFSLVIPAAVAVAQCLRRPLHMPLHASFLWLCEGMPQALCLPADAVGAPSEDPASRYRSLCVDHLAPQIEALAAAVRIAPRVLWSNVGHTLEYALSSVDAEAAAERAMLFERAMFFDTDAPNPLRHAIRYVKPASPVLPDPLRVRRVCCLRYLLPGEELLCSSCPLLLKLPEPKLEEQMRLLHACGSA